MVSCTVLLRAQLRISDDCVYSPKCKAYRAFCEWFLPVDSGSGLE